MNNVAQTIANQIGNRAFFMLGAKDLVAMEKGLQFKIGRNSSGGNKIRVVLDEGLDLYNVELWHVRGTNIFQVGESVCGVHVEQLHTILESLTGMYTRL